MKNVPGDIVYVGKRNVYTSNKVVLKYIKPKLRLLNLQLQLVILTYFLENNQAEEAERKIRNI